MKKTYQIIIIIGITFIFGFIVGFLVNGRVVSNRIDKMKNYYKETGFTREMMHIIKPTPEQKEQLIPILREHAHENRELMTKYRDNQKEIFEELKEDLKEVLTNDQIARLEDHWTHMQKRFQDKGPGQRSQRGKPQKEREHRGRR